MSSKSKGKGCFPLKTSFKFALEGMITSFKAERNMRIHISATAIVILLGFLLKISTYDWISLVLIIGMVISAELVNTAIEATVDLITEEKHPLAKLAKDVAASAVLVLAITSIILGAIIFIPKIIALF